MTSTRRGASSDVRARAERVRRLFATKKARRALKKWSREARDQLFNSIYNEDSSYIEPPQHKNAAAAIKALKKKANIVKSDMIADGSKNPKLDLAAIVEILMTTVAFTVDTTNPDSPSLLTYDYDRHVYTYAESVVGEYIASLEGSVTRNSQQSVVISLLSRWRELSAFIRVPDYIVAVGNGMFNLLTGELEGHDPRFIVTEKIDTDYVEDSYDPSLHGGRTYSKMCAELANYSPDRVQLAKQISKSIVTGHAPTPALFIIVGQGGDGKSTFFQMLVNAIGQSNCGFVNFEELSAPDKMAETINKKLVLGMDNNVNEYIKKTALLKSVASREYITHSRKFERAVSVRFSGAFVQLCNEMPRFAETGDSMQRRIVCFHAQHSHYKMGTEDTSIATLIEAKEFREHVLHEVLNEEKTPFYRDFNDADFELVRSTLDNEDLLAQFVRELESMGALSESNEYVPASHLYAAYREWLKSTSPVSSTMSSPTFAQRISKNMSLAGYDRSTDVDNVNPSALSGESRYDPELFGTYAQSEEFQKVIEQDSASAVFVRKREPEPQEIRRRGAVVCPATDYFGVTSDFLAWLRMHDEELYSALSEPEKAADELFGEEINEPKKKRATTSRVDSMLDESERRRLEAQKSQTKLRELKLRLHPPVDVRNAYRLRDVEELMRFTDWLEEITKIETDTADEDIVVASACKQAFKRLSQVAQSAHDGELSQLAESALSMQRGDGMMYARDFMKQLVKQVKSEKK